MYMSKTGLLPVTDKTEQVEFHVCFVHGLNGDVEKTWTNEKTKFHLPEELENDIEEAKVWSYGYSSSLAGGSKNLNDIPGVADNLLHCLLSENRFETGNIMFISHSLGGIIIKQLIRRLNDNSEYDENQKILLNRIKALAFLSTPHFGSNFVSVLNPLISRSNSIKYMQDLHPQSSYLKELSNWYKSSRFVNKIKHLTLYESNPIFSLPMKLDLFSERFKVANKSSFDPGLSEPPIPVDENHFSICKPEDKNSQTYKYIYEFINKNRILINASINKKTNIKRKTSIFIVYSHDESEGHRKWVKKIADRLSTEGFDVKFDGYVSSGELLDEFMEESMMNCDKIVAVCSSSYTTRANIGKGGVGYEKMILTKRMMTEKNFRVHPIIRDNNLRIDKMPHCFGNRKWINFEENFEFEEKYNELKNDLLDIPRAPTSYR